MLCITACPRSGSSLVSLLCSTMGIDMGTCSLPPDKWNPCGYEECGGFHAHVHSMLEMDNKTHFHSLKPDADEFIPIFRDWMEHRRLTARGPWGAKNNYVGFCASQWLASCITPPSLIIVNRDQAASIASYTRKYDEFLSGKNTLDMAAIVKRHNDILDPLEEAVHAAGGRVLRVRYEQLLASPEDGVVAIAQFIGRPVSQEAIDLINVDYKHF